jgi:hypothetical protein
MDNAHLEIQNVKVRQVAYQSTSHRAALSHLVRSTFLAIVASGIICAISSCVFDVSYVKLLPTEFQAAVSDGPDWTLGQDHSIGVGSGFPTKLRRGTRWQVAGHIPQGDVYRTSDQIVTVEASNIYEAMIVIHGDKLVGFYLPVEHSFVAAADPVAMPIQPGAQR